MVLLNYGDYELRSVETALGSYNLLHGITVWYDNFCIGVVEPENDALAKFTIYPSLIKQQKELDFATIQKLVITATDMIEAILSLV